MKNGKPKIGLIALLLSLSYSAGAQTDKGAWDVYMARYPDGPGSTVLDMSLKEGAPFREFPFLLKVGVHFKGCTAEGLPSDQTFTMLHTMSDSVSAYMGRTYTNKLSGSFTYKCSRADYFYIQDTIGVRTKLNEFLKNNFKSEDYFIEIKKDSAWQAYLEFLYPNEETLEYMNNTKVITKLQEAGDKLTESRQVDHWAYFKTDKDRQNYIDLIIAQGFNVEKKDVTKIGENPYSLQFSRMDKINLSEISAITLELRKQAGKNNGKYDGWETVVVRQ